jgi:hypothetical protein
VQNNSIYLQQTAAGPAGGDHVAIFDLNSNLITTTKAKCSMSQLIHIDNELHCIRKNHGVNHEQYDTKDGAFNTHNKLNSKQYDIDPSISNLICHRVIHFKSKHCILSFGGIIDGHVSDSVYCFSLLSKEWNKLQIKMPIKLHSFGIVKTRSERFVILFGGMQANAALSGDIWIFDTLKNVFTRSNLKTPSRGEFHAAIINDSGDKDEVLTFGFVSQCFKLKEFAAVQPLPFYLIQFISKWMQNQTVHLLANYGHWTINVDHILSDQLH